MTDNLPANIHTVHTTKGQNHNNRDLHTDFNCPHLVTSDRKVSNTMFFENKGKYPNRSFCSQCTNPRSYNKDKKKIKKQKKSAKLNDKLKEIGEKGGLEEYLKGNIEV